MLHELENNASESCVLAHWIPGRIEVMGKHTDYAGGNSLVCSTEGRGMAMTSTICEGKQRKITIVSILAPGLEHHATNTAASFRVNGRTVVHHTIDLSEEHQSKDNNSDSTNKDWRIYPTTVVRRLEKNFGLFAHCHETSTAPSKTQIEKKGYHIIIAVSSNLPPASGLSTSSAFVTGLFLTFDSHLGIRSSQTFREAIGTSAQEDTIYNLSTYLGNIENGTCYTRQRIKKTDSDTNEATIVLEGTKQGDGVGTFGGSEDHAAILMGKKRKLRLLSFCPTRPASFAVNMTNGPILYNSEDFNGEKKVVNQRSEFELPPNLVFVIAYSGARAEKAGQGTEASIGYNFASNMAMKAFEAYIACSDVDTSLDEKKLQTLADSIHYERKMQGISHTSLSGDQIRKSMYDKIIAGAVAVQRYPAIIDDFGNQLAKRFEQFYEESEFLVPVSAYCLAECDQLELLGSIVDKSHKRAVNILKNQIKETAWLPLWARGNEHQLITDPRLYIDDSKRIEETKANRERITALASSAFGAGFGGSCWALVHRDEADTFAAQWQSAYDEAFPNQSSRRIREFFITEPGPGAFLL